MVSYAIKTTWNDSINRQRVLWSEAGGLTRGKKTIKENSWRSGTPARHDKTLNREGAGEKTMKTNACSH